MNQSTRFWVLLVGALIVVTVLIGGAGSDGPPLDPRSVNPDGARGLVETLERFGATVELDQPVPSADTSTALLLDDRLIADDRQQIEAWVEGGGVLVVADISSPLAARSSGFASSTVSAGECTIPALAEARSISGGGRTFPVTGRSCFGDATRAFVVADQVGDGTILSIGGARSFTNAELDADDNAYVLISLLAPDPETASVAVLGPSAVAFGDEAGADQVSTRVSNSILMGIAAFLLYALHRMRRLGAVVPEPVPVQIRGSELVLQAGVLSERSRDPGAAADVIRGDFVDRWASRLALDEPTRDHVADNIARHTGTDVDQLVHALTAPVATDDDLVRCVGVLDQIDALRPLKGST